MSALKAIKESREQQWRMLKIDVRAYRDSMWRLRTTTDIVQARTYERNVRYWLRRVNGDCHFLHALRNETHLLEAIKDA